VHGRSLPHRKEVLNDDGSVTQFTVWEGALFDITDNYHNYAAPSTSNNEDTSNSVNGVVFDESKENNDGPIENRYDCDHDCVPCFEIDEEGIIKHWNEQMAELMGGIDERDICGQRLGSLVSDSNKGLLQNFLTKAKQHFHSSSPDQGDAHPHGTNAGSSKHCYSQDLTLSIRSSGDEVHLSIRCRVQNKPLRLLCSCVDITSLKEAEKEKIAALKLLEAEKKLSEFLSHEIRNPLTIAMEAAKSLKERADLNGNNKRCSVHTEAFGRTSYLDMIIQSISYVVDLLSNMLDINKLAAGKITLRPSICSLMEDIVHPIKEMMSVKDSEVPILFSGEEMTIFIDSLRLKQVITNLLSNAIKFSKNGVIKVDSRISKVGANGSEIPESLEISVSDTGPGVPKMYRTRLFSKWEQLGSTMSGAGIGLYLSRILITAMKGEVFLNEEYNSGIDGSPGAQFTIRIPIDVIKVPNDDREHFNISAYNCLSAAVKATNSGRPGYENFARPSFLPQNNEFWCNNNLQISGAYKLLLVDDDKIVRKVMRRRLSRIFPHATIDEVDCGEKAIEYTCCDGTRVTEEKKSPTTSSYDVIFIDHIMGEGLTGDQTIKILRDNDVDSLIIGVSGNSEEVSHISAGAEDFFQKPLPSQGAVIQRLVVKLPPPSGWRVLIVDDVKLNCHFLEQRLHRISSAHFTSMHQAQKRWEIYKTTSAPDAIRRIETEPFDLVVVDQELNDDNGIQGTDIASCIRKSELCKNCVIVLNSASDSDFELNQRPQLYNLLWPKPLPEESLMRQSLSEQLIQQIDDKF